jgi:hypothetical protein
MLHRRRRPGDRRPGNRGGLDDALAVEPLGEKIMKGVAQPALVFSVTRALAGGAVRRS